MISSPRLQDASLEEIENELATRDLLTFTKRTKPDYLAGWFHAKVAEALDRFLENVLAKRSPRLIIVAPPQHGKSELTSRRLPAFAFGQAPGLRIAGTAYAADLAEGFCSDVQRIIDSPEYSSIFPATRILAEGAKSSRDKRRSELFTVVGHPGIYRAVGRGGPLTGKPVDLLIVDDPFKDFEEAISETIRESAWNWLATVAMSRLQEGGGAIIMATRWHQDDIIGRLLERQKGLWELIEFSALAEHDEEHRKMGEPLSVERYSQEHLEGIRDGGLVNSYQWGAIYQGHPSPLGGGIFKRDDWRYYDVDAPRKFDEVIQSWDFTFKDTKTSDMVSGQVWGYIAADKFLIDRVNDRMSFGASKVAIQTMSSKHPNSYRKFIEDKANGPAIIDSLKSDIPGMIAVEPEGGKIARAHAVSGEVEAHNVYLPARKNDQGVMTPLPWVHDFIEQHAAFPTGTHDDDVDSCTQALAQIRKLSTSLSLVQYMKQQHAVEIAKVQTSAMIKPLTNENTEACPACASVAIVKIAGAKRCNQCGHQWGGPAAVPQGANRRGLAK